jgi:hypothetical protein
LTETTELGLCVLTRRLTATNSEAVLYHPLSMTKSKVFYDYNLLIMENQGELRSLLAVFDDASGFKYNCLDV